MKVYLPHCSKLDPAHLEEGRHRGDQDAEVGDGEAQQVDVHDALGKVVHFFRPTFPNPLPMLWMLIWGLFPIGPRLEHLHWIGSIGGVAGMPMLCQFQTMHYQSPAN